MLSIDGDDGGVSTCLQRFLAWQDPGDHTSFRLSSTDVGGPGLKNGLRILGVLGTGVESCLAGVGVGGFFLVGNNDVTGIGVLGTGVERCSAGEGARGGSFFFVFCAF